MSGLIKGRAELAGDIEKAHRCLRQMALDLLTGRLPVGDSRVPHAEESGITVPLALLGRADGVIE